MSYTYEQGKAMAVQLMQEVDKWDVILKSFPRGAMGLVTNEAKKSAEFVDAKKHADLAFEKLRLFNAGFTKKYKREILAERKQKLILLQRSE